MVLPRATRNEVIMVRGAAAVLRRLIDLVRL